MRAPISSIPRDIFANLVRRYQAGESVTALADEFSLSTGTIYKRLGKRPAPSNRLCAAKQRAVCQKYIQCASIQKTVAELSVSTGRVRKTLADCGIPHRRHHTSRRRFSINHDAFAVDSEEASYWTGFLMADGSISADHEVRLELTGRDVGHLEKFRTFLNSGRPIYHTKARPIGKTKYMANPSALVCVDSAKLCADLAARGVVRNKTYRTDPGRFTDDRHFWRGILDGDGCITLAKDIKNYPNIHLVGSLTMVSAFVDFVHRNGIVSRAKPRKTNNIYIASFPGRSAVALCKLLYKDCTIALQRKLEKARFVASLFISTVGHNHFTDTGGQRPYTNYVL